MAEDDSSTSAGDFDRFYAAARPAVVRALTLTLGDAELASEAVDEAMVRAVQRWAQVSTYDNPEGWVYRVALNWSTSILRRRRRHDSLAERWPIEELVAGPDLDPALARAVAALPVRLRAVVVCRFHLDLSNDATAACLGIRPGTVKSRLHRALAQLQRDLTEQPEPDHPNPQHANPEHETTDPNTDRPQSEATT